MFRLFESLVDPIAPPAPVDEPTRRLRPWLRSHRGPASRAASGSRGRLTGRVVNAYTKVHSVRLFAQGDRERRHARDAMAATRATFRREMRLVRPSLAVEPGRKVGLVGRSGAGKSTLVKLLLRFHEAEAGDILIDGPPIPFLDEATSALGSKVEAAIRGTLAATKEGKTVLAIAHRRSAIARADRIVLLEGGRILEDGPHGALLARGGLSARLGRRPSGGFRAPDPGEAPEPAPRPLPRDRPALAPEAAE